MKSIPKKRLNLEAEEVVLRLALEEEELQKEVETLQAELTELQEQFDSESSLAQKNAATFNSDLKKKQAIREEKSKLLKRSLLTKYENIKKLRGGVAVVPARNGSCTGCNMRLRPQLYNIILTIQTLETCPSCKRILYSEEGFTDANS